MDGRKRYPTDLIAAADGNWCRIHEGHNLPLDVLQRDFQMAHGRSDGLQIDEVTYHLKPRVKWCSNYGDPCWNDGEWHHHWFEGSDPFTIVYRPLAAVGVPADQEAQK